MAVTIFGIFQFLIGAYLFCFGSIRSLFLFVMASSLFGGSASFYLFGGSSVSPAYFALTFLIMRCLSPASGQYPAIAQALRGNIWLLAFVLYGVLTAMIMPHLLEGQIDVTPLRGQVRDRYGSVLARILASEPLHFTPQNVTTAIYMLGSLSVAVAAYLVSSKPGGRAAIVRTAAIVGIAHATLGFAGVVLKNTPANVIFDVLRNGNYAQLDHEYAGLVRMNGVWPEASSFASFALIWFVFNFECWLRGTGSRLSGIAALSLGAALVVSTSGTGYVGLVIFGATIALRAALTPSIFPARKTTILTLIALLVATLVSALLVTNPVLAAQLQEMLAHMTVDKPDSFSGRQRLFWAEQGIRAFQVSSGLGVGPGSFRSSSLATAILGSMGVIGAVTFLAHLARAFRPLARSTYLLASDRDANVAAAAGWAVLIGCGVASVSAPSANPGIEISLLSGAAIALRRLYGRDRVESVVADPKNTSMGPARLQPA